MPENSEEGAESVIESAEIESVAEEFQNDITDTFDLDQEDVEITAERDPVPGDKDLVELKARWVL